MGSWGEQYSTGFQGDCRKTFWRSGMKVCPRCQSTKIKQVVDCAGCRHNGDGYGTETFDCLDCAWATSFLYDEADGSPYYYETRDWEWDASKDVQYEPSGPYIPPPDKQLDEKDTLKFRDMRTRYPDKQLRQVMGSHGYSAAVIDAFLLEEDTQKEAGKKERPKSAGSSAPKIKPKPTSSGCYQRLRKLI